MDLSCNDSVAFLLPFKYKAEVRMAFFRFIFLSGTGPFWIPQASFCGSLNVRIHVGVYHGCNMNVMAPEVHSTCGHKLCVK